jgi:hypothetical protein
MMKGRTITRAWLQTWDLSAKGTNPPFFDVIPEGLGYLRCFAMDSTYIEEQGSVESKGAYKRRVYYTLYIMNRRETGMKEMRIVKLWPTTDWAAVWGNLHSMPVTDAMKTAWYKAINGILPTNDRLYRIRISTTDKCHNCGMQDTVIHRFIECGEGPKIWKWTQQKIALIRRTIPNRIASDWFLRPQCTLWPHTRQRAVMWILANMV